MFKSIGKVGIVMAIINRLRLVVRLLRDPRVPLHLKAIPFLSFLSFALPIDMIPVLGQMDELGIMMVAAEVFVRLAPQDVVYEHQADIEAGGKRPREDNVVEGEWHAVNRNG